MKVRQKGLELWSNNPDSDVFDISMKKYFVQLRIETKNYHSQRAIQRRIFNGK